MEIIRREPCGRGCNSKCNTRCDQGKALLLFNPASVMEIPFKHTPGTTCRDPPGQFANAVTFLTDILSLEMISCDKDKEFDQKLPAGDIMEIFGSKNLWHPFTTSAAWEIIVADIRYRMNKR